jgi:transposase
LSQGVVPDSGHLFLVVTMSKAELAPVRKRQVYPEVLKAQIVAECGQPGTSIAGVALTHGVM